MVLSKQPQQYISVEAFLLFLDTEADAETRYELVEGVIVEMPASSKYNSTIAMNIGGEFRIYLKKNPIGYITGADGGFRLSENTVRIPDVAYTASDRYLKGDSRLVEGPPNIAIEVISPSETQKMVTNKIYEYFQAGVEMVWSVYPETKTVDVWQMNNDLPHAVRYGLSDQISLNVILPDFSIAVQDVFDQIP